MVFTKLECIKLYHVVLSEEELELIKSAIDYDLESLTFDTSDTDDVIAETILKERDILAHIEDILGKGETNAQN